MNDYRLKSIACFIGLAMFYLIPIVKTLLGDPLPQIPTLLSIGLGFAFGISGFYLHEKGKLLEKRKHVAKFEDDESDDFVDTKINEPCPTKGCKGQLMIISRADGKLIDDSTKGYVYCKKCELEIPREDWDEGIRY